MLKENMESLVAHLENMVQAKTVTGEPIISNGKTIIPNHKTYEFEAIIQKVPDIENLRQSFITPAIIVVLT